MSSVVAAQPVPVIEGGSPTVFVTDLDRAVQFYVDTLGLKLAYRAGPHFAMVDAGAGFHIGLHPPGERTPPPGAMGGVQVGLAVNCPIMQAVAALQRRGVTFRSDEGGRTIIDDSAVKLAFFADPDGNVLYLCEV